MGSVHCEQRLRHESEEPSCSDPGEATLMSAGHRVPFGTGTRSSGEEIGSDQDGSVRPSDPSGAAVLGAEEDLQAVEAQSAQRGAYYISVATQTDTSMVLADHARVFVETGWFSFDMLDKILQLPHYRDFTAAQTALLRNRFFCMRAAAENLVKAKSCVCCGVVGHAIDACPVRSLLTSVYSKDPIAKSLFGTIKGLHAGWAAGSDAAEEAIAHRLQEKLQAKLESQDQAALQQALGVAEAMRSRVQQIQL